MNELSDKLCGCGCGGFTSVAVKTIAKEGIKKGDPLPFIKGHKYLLGRRFECTQCGKVAYKRPSRQKRNKHSFCSRECADTHHSLNVSGENNPAWNGGKKRVRCSICEKEFERTPALIKDGKPNLCSTKCAGIWKSINKSGEKIKVQCAHCGNDIYKTPSRIKTGRNSFCNSACRGLWQSDRKACDHPAWKGGGVEVLCDHCGEKIFRKKSKVKKNKNHFCNRKCMGAWQSANKCGEKHPTYKGGYTQIFCVQCNEKVFRRPSMIEEGKNYFCSRECASAWRVSNFCGENNSHWKGGLTQFICDQCGKEFERKPSITKQYVRHFCSSDCMSIWRMINWRGENSPAWLGGLDGNDYCPTWTDKQFKEYIFERDGYRCQNPNCWGTSKRLNRHHIDYDKNNCEPINIITVCTSCNTRANANRAWHTAYYQAIMDKRFNIRSIKNEYSIENNIKGVEIWKENKAHSPALHF